MAPTRLVLKSFMPRRRPNGGKKRAKVDVHKSSDETGGPLLLSGRETNVSNRRLSQDSQGSEEDDARGFNTQMYRDARRQIYHIFDAVEREQLGALKGTQERDGNSKRQRKLKQEQRKKNKFGPFAKFKRWSKKVIARLLPHRQLEGISSKRNRNLRRETDGTFEIADDNDGALLRLFGIESDDWAGGIGRRRVRMPLSPADNSDNEDIGDGTVDGAEDSEKGEVSEDDESVRSRVRLENTPAESNRSTQRINTHSESQIVVLDSPFIASLQGLILHT